MPAAMRAVLAKFDQAVRAASQDIDWKGALLAIRLEVIGETRKNFEQGRSPDGVPWQKLRWPRPNTKGNDNPLHDEGLLGRR